MRYRVLLTDVGNVIAPFFLDRFTRNLSQMTGLQEAEVDSRLYHEMAGERIVKSGGLLGIHRGILTGEVTPDRFFAEVQDRLECSMHRAQFWYAFRDVFDPNRRLVALWNSLRNNRKVERIILVSDADPRRLTRALSITYFEPNAIAVSYEVGQLKPHPDMYRRALELAGVPPQECLFVDDVLENVQAAREFGIESFHYQYPKVGLEEATDILANEFRHIGLLD